VPVIVLDFICSIELRSCVTCDYSCSLFKNHVAILVCSSFRARIRGASAIPPTSTPHANATSKARHNSKKERHGMFG
jgi:hypothetical protein